MIIRCPYYLNCDFSEENKESCPRDEINSNCTDVREFKKKKEKALYSTEKAQKILYLKEFLTIVDNHLSSITGCIDKMNFGQAKAECEIIKIRTKSVSDDLDNYLSRKV